MIDEIRIRDLGVIDESTLELRSGFNVITGETGAGKTMLVTALGLLLGARGDSGAVRKGAASARVEGLVRLPDALHSRVADLGGVVEDGDLILARQVSAESRSRAYVGGTAVPVAALSELADELVAVHGQSDQHRLLKPEAQRAALDAHAGESVAVPLAEYADKYTRWRQIAADLRELRESLRERNREADLLRLGVEEIERVGPEADEDVELKAEGVRLSHADGLRVAADTAHRVLSTDDGVDATALLGEARRALESVAEHDQEAAGLASRAAELSYLASDLAADVASYAAGLESDPARLAWIGDRRAQLSELTRKYGESISEVLAWADTASRRLLELDGSEERIGDLEKEVDDLANQVRKLAAQITKARTAAAKDLASKVTAELHALFMPDARLVIEVRPAELSASGGDSVELLLAANKGSEARPLAKAASGGEVSRLMLAIEVVLAATRAVPTFVFDEVDAGVGGAAAVEIGRRLAKLAVDSQVLVVTHLPQVAAFADHHVVVRKSSEGAITTSGVEHLNDDGRVRELSRMLAGLEDSETARAHARELLATARDSRTGTSRRG